MALYEQASPVKYVVAGDAPMLLFQGTKMVRSSTVRPFK